MAATTRQMSETKVLRLQDLMEIHGEFLVTHQCHHIVTKSKTSTGQYMCDKQCVWWKSRHMCTQYQSVAGLNEETYIQIDYQVKAIYWHDFFDKVLLYMFNKLCKDRVECHIHVFTDNTSCTFCNMSPKLMTPPIVCSVISCCQN